MNRRTFLRTLASVGAALVLPVKWVAERVPDYSFFAVGREAGEAFWAGFNGLRIAASDASPEVKAFAHLVATGENDQVVFDEAFALMPEGGTIQLSPGTFHMPDGFKGPNNLTIFGSPDFQTRFTGKR